ncbi:MAG: Unknown protein, partial [uncultured Campylobacterales bacterium]
MLTLLLLLAGGALASGFFGKFLSPDGMGKVGVEQEEPEINEEELLYNMGDQASESQNDDVFANTEELSEEEKQD